MANKPSANSHLLTCSEVIDSLILHRKKRIMDSSEHEENINPDQDSQNQENPQSDPMTDYAPKKAKSMMPVIIGVAFVLMAVLLYFFIQNRGLKEEVEATQVELNQAVLQLDSIGSELDQKILEITRLGGDVDTLLLVKAELEAEKKKLLSTRTANRQLIVGLSDKVDGYQELLVLKDQEIIILKKQNEALFTENTTLKVEKNQLSDSINSLAGDRDQLSEQVAIASKLRVTGMKIFAVNSKGKERESEFRNRHVENLRIEFMVNENRVAPIEGKGLLVRVIAPDNNVLFDVTRGSGSFNFEGREMFYTAKKEILYDRASQKVTLLYNKGSEYALGKHTVEVYTDDYLMGRGSFVVK